MDIKELDKRQLILLTLLITFVVSIATGIVTVSLMNQMPKTVPQTINNVIQRTIERVTTIESPTKENTNITDSKKEKSLAFGDGEAVVSIYSSGSSSVADNNLSGITNEINNNIAPETESKELGQGVIISEIGLVLVESSILNNGDNYKIILNKIHFDANILKKFNNGFTILKISQMKNTTQPLTGATAKIQQ